MFNEKLKGLGVVNVYGIWAKFRKGKFWYFLVIAFICEKISLFSKDV
jgi:hypothetical protein